MKDGIKIIAYIVGVLILGCLIAPWLWYAGQGLGGAMGWEFLTDQTFQRYFNRSMLVAAVALLYPLIKSLRITSWRDFGLEKNPYRWRDVLTGFLLASILLFLIGLLGFWLEVYRVQNNIVWEKFAKIPGTAIVVPLIEEWFFRAAMLSLVLRTASARTAILFTSAIYSIVHFLKPMEVDIGSIQWFSGFQLLPYSFHQFAEPLLLLGGFFTLFAIGVILAVSTLRTRSLWLAIGLHAGWIAGSRAFNIVFKQRDELIPWYGPRIEIGLAPLLTVIFTGILVMIYLRYASKRPTTPMD